MKFSTCTTALFVLASTSALAHESILKRDIGNPGDYTLRGNISFIASWAYAPLAYATITASNSTSDLTYLCESFSDLSSRYYAASPEPSGDMANIACDAICGASKANPPAPLPIWYNTLWYMKSYTAGMFVVQSYWGGPSGKGMAYNKQYYADMCWYLEASLLRGLWAPCRVTDEGICDVEGSYCAASGSFGKGDYSMYTNATQPITIAQQADILVSKLVARMLRVVLSESAQVEYICTNWSRFKAGVKGLGLMSEVVSGLIYQDKKIVKVEQARKDELSAITELFTFQLLNAGTEKDYYPYLYKTLNATGLAKVRLDGYKVINTIYAAI